MSIDWDEADVDVLGPIIRARGIETDLANADLVGYARAAIGEIADRGYGPQDDVTFVAYGPGTLISLSPAAASVSNVTEAGIELVDGTDYRLRPGGLFLERLSAGYPEQWYGRVTGTIAVAAAGDRYDRVVLDLVKLALQYSGLDARRDGDYSEESIGARGGGQKSYQDEREQLISELAPAGVLFA